jgi:hypothetical protein
MHLGIGPLVCIEPAMVRVVCKHIISGLCENSSRSSLVVAQCAKRCTGARDTRYANWKVCYQRCDVFDNTIKVVL